MHSQAELGNEGKVGIAATTHVIARRLRRRGNLLLALTSTLFDKVFLKPGLALPG